MTVLRSREALLALAILALLVAVAARFPAFVEPANLGRVFNDTAPLILLALGQTVVILTRCIDLSVAANLALTGMVAALVNVAFPGLPVGVIVLGAVAMGAALGALNGLMVWRLAIPPIVATLGTLTIFRGLVFVVSGGEWINAHEMSDAFTAFPRAELFGLPALSWIALVAVALVAALIRWAPLGRAFYAVGGNPSAAVYAGIDPGRTQFWAFTLSGALSGLAGYLWIARYQVAYVEIAAGFELEVVAACVIGGISIAGGVGTVAGAVLGALFLGIVKNALPVVGVSPFWQLAISGTAIVVAVIANGRGARRPGRQILRREPHRDPPREATP